MMDSKTRKRNDIMRDLLDEVNACGIGSRESLIILAGNLIWGHTMPCGSSGEDFHPYLTDDAMMYIGEEYEDISELASAVRVALAYGDLSGLRHVWSDELLDQAGAAFDVDGVPREYDDGFGSLWVYREAVGHWSMAKGVVRARSYEDAWEICEDAICDDAALADLQVNYEDWDPESGELPEGYGYRPNGIPTCSGLTEPIYYAPPMEHELRELTPEVPAAEGISVFWRPWDA